MALAKVFKNRVPNCRISHPDGTIITFNNGKCITTLQRDIDYLNKVVADGDTYVYIDPEESEVDTEELTTEGMHAKLKREAVEEYIAMMNAPKLSGSNEEGSRTGINMGTSATVLNSVGSNSNAPAPVVEKAVDVMTDPTPATPAVSVKLPTTK